MSLLAKIIILVLVVTAISLIFSIILRVRKQKNSIEESLNKQHFDDDDDFSSTDEIITVRKCTSADEDIFQDEEPVMVSASETEYDMVSTTRSNQENLVIVNILAKEKQQFVGYELLQAILSSGLRFGEMDIFHRHKELSGKGPVLFSLANATEPGTFDLQKMGGVSSPGLTLFLRFSNHPTLDLERFDLLMQTANQLCEDLDGELYDDQRNKFTEQTIEKYKKRINAQNSTVREDDEVVAV